MLHLGSAYTLQQSGGDHHRELSSSPSAPHAHTCTLTQVYSHMRTIAHTCTLAHTRAQLHTHALTHALTYARTRTLAHTHIHTSAQLHTRTLHMHIHTHTHTPARAGAWLSRRQGKCPDRRMRAMLWHRRAPWRMVGRKGHVDRQGGVGRGSSSSLSRAPGGTKSSAIAHC